MIFSASSSFAVPGEGLDRQGPELPAVPAPEDCVAWTVPRMFSMEVAIPPEDGVTAWPSRFWSRFTVPIGDDPLLHACAFASLSDVSADLHRWDTDGYLPAASLDHAFWLHHPAPMDDWVFTDYTARTIAGNRGLYTGSLFDRSGRMVASIAQEALYRKLR